MVCSVVLVGNSGFAVVQVRFVGTVGYPVVVQVYNLHLVDPLVRTEGTVGLSGCRKVRLAGLGSLGFAVAQARIEGIADLLGYLRVRLVELVALVGSPDLTAVQVRIAGTADYPVVVQVRNPSLVDPLVQIAGTVDRPGYRMERLVGLVVQVGSPGFAVALVRIEGTAD